MSEEVLAEMVANVWKVVVNQGDDVAEGDTICILESMKMETALVAPMDAVVAAIRCAPGDQVGNGQLLIELEPIQEAP